MENERDAETPKRNGRRRLVLFPLPFQGHINPMLQLANILHSNGFSITIIHTTFNFPNPSNHPHFTFVPISDGLSETEASNPDLIALLSVLNLKCVKPFEDCLAKLLADVSEEPITCLISDAILPFTRAVAERLKLPRIVLRTGGVSSFVVFAAYPILLEKGHIPIRDSRLEELVPELPPLRIKDLPVIKTSNPEALYEVVNSMVKETKASSGLIWNSFEELEQPALNALRQDFPIPIFPIGPFHKHFPTSSSSLIKEDQSSISWLNMQEPNSVIYVSFGSIAAIDKTEFLEIAWGLANSKRPFLWVVRPGLIRGSYWLEPLPNGFLENLEGRGHIVQWAPQQEVLCHPAVGAFWTHNGWNSTMESVCEGVPMICMPCFTDQLVNARYVSNVWRVGVQLENGLERGKIEKAIGRLMEDKEMRGRALQWKEKANLSLRQGGSSYQSLQCLISYISTF
ncbi:unnamed protein product [Ilex paraguariensis]|uniref:UDP-glycosyltransferase 76F1 n=1 Tax=Ilex paraguariensis TaxID=185542 RepID=A0ABC8T752_9AQUA